MVTWSLTLCIRVLQQLCERFPWIVEAARKRWLPQHRRIHSGKYDEEFQLYAFDILALNGEDRKGSAVVNA